MATTTTSATATSSTTTITTRTPATLNPPLWTHQLWCGHPDSLSCQTGSRQCSSTCCRGSACWSWMAGSWRSAGFRWGGRGGCPGHRRSPRRSPDTSAARRAVLPQQDRAPRSLWCWQILPLAKMHWQSISWNVGPHWKLQESKHRMVTVVFAEFLLCCSIVFKMCARVSSLFTFPVNKIGMKYLNVILCTDLKMIRTICTFCSIQPESVYLKVQFVRSPFQIIFLVAHLKY